MEDKQFPQRKNIRLPDFDYSQPGYYFITICAKERLNLFGKIVKTKMILNEFGKCVHNELTNGLMVKYNHIDIDEFVIMPNHLHFILIINQFLNSSQNVSPKLGNIIAFFKYHSTKEVNNLRKDAASPVWQRSYYEHVIRDNDELFQIRNYIQNNPLEWESDEYYTK